MISIFVFNNHLHSIRLAPLHDVLRLESHLGAQLLDDCPGRVEVLGILVHHIQPQVARVNRNRNGRWPLEFQRWLVAHIRWQGAPRLGGLVGFRCGGNGASSTGATTSSSSSTHSFHSSRARIHRCWGLRLLLNAARHAADGFGKLCRPAGIHLAGKYTMCP